MFRVGAVILHYRRGEATVPTVEAARSEGVAELVIVDNASHDGSWEALKNAAPDCNFVEAPFNGGWAAGMRVGIHHLRTRDLDAVLLLTHECILALGALEALVTALQSDPGLGAVGPVLVTPPPGRHVFSSGGSVDRRSWTPLNSEQPIVRLTEREWLDGACVLLRSASLDVAQLFDDRYFLYLEDVHLGAALKAAGWRIAVTPAARAEQSTSGMPLYYGVRNRLIFARTWGGSRAVARRLGWDALSLGADVAKRRWPLMRWRLAGLWDGVLLHGGPARTGAL